MFVLVINSGSSSIKAALFEINSFDRLFDVRIGGIGEAHSDFFVGEQRSKIQCANHSEGLQAIFDALRKSHYELSTIAAVGHRVLHGGEQFVEPTMITDEVEQVIEQMNELAPLHNPACLAGIRAARQVLDSCPHVAVFDTAFHSTLPKAAKLYALPNKLADVHALRRFGFHGISHEYVSKTAAEALGYSLHSLRIISCHLGNGCSMTAVENARSVETSMGMTPLEGLVMGSRSGDIDPGILIQLMRSHLSNVNELDTLLNKQSGLLGLTGTNNMSDIEKRAANGSESCQQAIQIFTHRVRKYLGAYAAVMGGVDAVIFTGGIGENSSGIRQQIAQQFEFLGLAIDKDRNRNVTLTAQQPVVDISATTSRVKLLVVATNEERAIAGFVSEKLQHTA